MNKQKLKMLVIWAGRILLALAFAMAGIYKLAGDEHMVRLFTQLGAEPWLRIITGTIELVCALEGWQRFVPNPAIFLMTSRVVP